MLPREILAEARTPAGEPITLAREGIALVVRVRNEVLMSSRVHGSEEVLAEVGCEGLRARRHARVLVGGLGLGFTLRAALEQVGADAEVVVRELIPALVDWNRGPLADLARRPLEDPRARVEVGDVMGALGPPARWDAILLDVDNGPEALTVPSNRRLYGPRGLEAIAASLHPDGVVVVWSAFESKRFERALRAAGLRTSVVRVRARGEIAKGSRHLLYVGRRAAARRG
jgi:spermidine synthase